MATHPTLPSGRVRERLDGLYGVRFPDGLFHLHEFLRTYPRDEKAQAMEDLGMSATGVLQVLDRLADGRDVAAALPLVLHYRFYRDPPEFFTCLHGDCDGQHWGMIWDDPAAGFRGAASYYNNDGDRIAVYGGLLGAVADRIEGRIETAREYLGDGEDPEGADDYERQIHTLTRMNERLNEFVDGHGIALDEGRPAGVESDTGLDLLVPAGGADEPASWAGCSVFRGVPPPAERVAGLIAACDRGDVIPALLWGRSLWHWGGADHADAAYRLLRAGYAAVGRPRLIDVLDVHHRHRGLASVDLLGA